MHNKIGGCVLTLQHKEDYGRIYFVSYVSLRQRRRKNKCANYSLPAADLIAYMSAGRKLDKLANNVIQDVKKPW